jgi:hypothetical protein
MTRTKRTLLLVVIIGFIIGSIGAAVYVKKTNQKSTEESSKTHQLNTSSAQQNLLTWEDPAGFTFQYLEGLTVDRHEEDNENYAHIEFTHPDHPGNIIVWAKDTTADSVDGWLKVSREFSGGSTIDTTLGQKPAKKILLDSPKRMIVAVMDADVVITVETLLTTPFWSDIAQTIIDTFAFVQLPADAPAEAQAPAGGDAVGAGAYDEEEVLE